MNGIIWSIRQAMKILIVLKNNIMQRYSEARLESKHFYDWYVKLREQGYGRFTSFTSARFNYEHFKIDGTYK